MNVLSLYDGISCGQLALDGRYDRYFASEISQKAIQVTQSNFPDTIQIGDVTKLDYRNGILYTEHGEFEVDFDLVLAGPPCQDLSRASSTHTGLRGLRSGLYGSFRDLLEKIDPTWFLMENVLMDQRWMDEISRDLGMEPHRIDSAHYTAQSRQRLYWYNWSGVPHKMPNPHKMLPPDLEDIIESGWVDRTKSYCIDANYGKGSNPKSYARGRRQIVFMDESSVDLFKSKGKETKVDEVNFRILTPEECEELQSLPRGYTRAVAKTHRYYGIGNGWTVRVVNDILHNYGGPLG